VVTLKDILIEKKEMKKRLRQIKNKERRLKMVEMENLTPGQKRKVNLAAQRGTRVLVVRTIDTHFVLDITRQADRVLNYLRKNLLIKFKPEDVVPLMERYYSAIRELNDATKELCRFVGVEYRPPRGFEDGVSEEVKEVKKERKAEKLEEMLRAEEL
jgi:hypothetical protein